MKAKALKQNKLKVRAKHKKSSGLDTIIVSGKDFYKVIPAVIFSANETKKLLDIIDKVEIENK